MRHAIGTLAFTTAAFMRPKLGRAHMQRYQLRRLRALLQHANHSVPFYHDWFVRNDFEPDDVRSLADLSRLPVMGKQELAELRKSFTRDDIARQRLIEHQTSGSTGMPVSFLRAAHEERRLNILRWRMQWELGLRPGDRIARVKTNWEPLSRRFNRLQSLVRATRLLDVRIFDCLKDPADNYRKIAAFRPHILSGYPGALVRIAEQHRLQGGCLDRLRRVGTGGETLTPTHRRALEQTFGVPVYDSYGTTECNLAARQCRETGFYHVIDDGILLEVCRDGVPVAAGESGEVVITALHSRTMPVIRYGMGDIAVAGPSPCPCGSPFSTIRSVQGRTIDFLHTPDGRELHPFDLLNDIVLSTGDTILEYQFVQETIDRFCLLIVPMRDVAQDELSHLRDTLLAKLGPRCRVDIQLTDAIPVSQSGKRHFCRSALHGG